MLMLVTSLKYPYHSKKIHSCNDKQRYHYKLAQEAPANFDIYHCSTLSKAIRIQYGRGQSASLRILV